jgi:hypothetical protein
LDAAQLPQLQSLFGSVTAAALHAKKQVGDTALFPEHARLSEPLLLSDEVVPLDSVAHACIAGGGTSGLSLVIVGSVVENDVEVPMAAIADLWALKQLAATADVGVGAACAAWRSLQWQTLRLPFDGCEAWQIELVPVEAAPSGGAVMVDTSSGDTVYMTLAPLALHKVVRPSWLSSQARILAVAANARGRELAMVTDERQLIVVPLPETPYTASSPTKASDMWSQDSRVSSPAATPARTWTDFDPGNAGATHRSLRSFRSKLEASPLRLAVSSCTHPCSQALLVDEESLALRLHPFDLTGPLADLPRGDPSHAASATSTVTFDPPREYLMCNRQHFLRVRSLPSSSAPVIGKVTADKCVTVLARQGDWLRIAMQPNFTYPKPERLTPTQAWARQFAVDALGFEHVMLRRSGARMQPTFDPRDPLQGQGLVAEPLFSAPGLLQAAEVATQLAREDMLSTFAATLELTREADVLDLSVEVVISQTAADLLSRDGTAASSACLLLHVWGSPQTGNEAFPLDGRAVKNVHLPTTRTLAITLDASAAQAVRAGHGDAEHGG